MRKTISVVSMAAILLFGITANSAYAGKKARKAAAIAAAIALSVAAIKARDRDNDRHRYRNHGYRYREHHRSYDDQPDRWYPAGGITCYQRLHACYHVSRGYSARWTRREFH